MVGLNRFDYTAEESTELNRKMKLVRDNDIGNMTKKKQQFTYHVADESEYAQFLDLKLKEETEEYLVKQTPEELIDILEIIHVLCKKHDLTFEQLDSLRKEKQEARGSFERGFILEKW